MIMSSMDYSVPWLAELFHYHFPRWDLTFLPVNATFNPGDTPYRESLIIWAAVPVLWLVLTLLVFLMYFCYRCCQRDIEKKQRVPCLRWTMAILAIFTCAVIGLGFYGNEQVHKGMNAFSTACSNVDSTTERMKQEVSFINKEINDSVKRNIDNMQQIYQTHPELEDEEKQNLQRLSEKSVTSARSIGHSVRRIEEKAAKADMGQTTETSATVGFWGWIGVIILLGCFILLCLNLLLGIGRSSKCVLLLFCALGIIFLVVCWIAAGIFFGTSLAVSDFCIDPDTYFEKYVTGQIMTHGNGQMVNGLVSTPKETMEKDVLRYYIACNTHVAKNPLRTTFQDAQEGVRQANNTLNRALNIAYGANLKQQLKPYVQLVNQGLDNTVEMLLHLTALVECTNLHKDYINAINGICYTALPGLVFLLLSTVLTGLLLTILVLMASRAWRHFSRSQYVERQDGGPKSGFSTDSDDPFLECDDGSVTHYSFTRQGPRGNPRAAGAGEQITMQRRNTPPPASPDYNSFDPRRGNRPPPQAPIAPADTDDDSYFGRETYA